MKNLSVEERNEQFKKLSVTKRRVLLAKEVLYQMKLKFLIPKTGAYVRSNKLIEASNLVIDNSELELKEVFDKDKSCIACGIGSLFVCSVKLFNKLKLSDIATNLIGLRKRYSLFKVSSENIHQYLSDSFSQFELDKIEAAFEMTDSLFKSFLFSKAKAQTIVNASNYFDNSVGKKLDAKQRLKAIMNNIIKNNGKFCVSKKYGER